MILLLATVLGMFCAWINPAYAQQNHAVSGKVVDTANAPLPGVSVYLKGTQTGTVTDANGIYRLSGIPANGTLVFSFVGMKSQEILINARASINITLEEESVGLDEVVAIGYGTVKKKDLLGAVSVVKEEALAERASGNVVESLRGLTSGVKVTTSGQPGSNASVIIRGLGSLTNNNPLFIINGA